ncbi:uncharacterized protein B0H18DRAFT_1115959 [Fomitopsis serialis]|uniref:uncharacterized protein n=1 Tax=Fomitopsis serialis TaxID=139415 RepID=UPI002007F6DA|nr:uncharacterized protein B0H18DRAFT_1115959 [Neoantrodia serialis]KAH9932289.1 hypothetical protein B0H18DRAFT_1115959 [Neoantrodia serialis]
MAIGVGDSPGKRKVKRPRTEDSRGEQVTRTTNPDLWFNDGSIILVARGVAFRVYKDLLAKSPAEKIEGCHIVHLDDSPLDVANMLKLVFFGTQLYPSDEQVGFPFVASWIKMAHKYRMEGTLALALKRLKSFFSDDLDDWLGLPSTARPTASLSSKELLHGVALADGAMERLDDKDIQMCMDARNVLTGRTILSVLEIWALPVSSGCYDEDACQRALEAEVDVTRLEDRWLADGVQQDGPEPDEARAAEALGEFVPDVWSLDPAPGLNRSGTRPRGSDVGENDDQDDDATQGTADDVPSDNESAGEDANEGDVHEEDATAKDAKKDCRRRRH